MRLQGALRLSLCVLLALQRLELWLSKAPGIAMALLPAAPTWRQLAAVLQPLTLLIAKQYCLPVGRGLPPIWLPACRRLVLSTLPLAQPLPLPPLAQPLPSLALASLLAPLLLLPLLALLAVGQVQRPAGAYQPPAPSPDAAATRCFASGQQGLARNPSPSPLQRQHKDVYVSDVHGQLPVDQTLHINRLQQRVNIVSCT